MTRRRIDAMVLTSIALVTAGAVGAAVAGQPTNLSAAPRRGDELCVSDVTEQIPLGANRVVAVRGGDLWLHTCAGRPLHNTHLIPTARNPQDGQPVGVFSTWRAYQRHEADFQALQVQRDELRARIRELNRRTIAQAAELDVLRARAAACRKP